MPTTTAPTLLSTRIPSPPIRAPWAWKNTNPIAATIAANATRTSMVLNTTKTTPQIATPKSRTLSRHPRNKSQTNGVNKIRASRTIWHYKARRPDLYLPPPHPFSCTKSFGQKRNLSCHRLSSLSAGRWGICTYTRILIPFGPVCFPPLSSQIA